MENMTESKTEIMTENTIEITTLQKINTVIFFTLSGYCLSMQLIALYKAHLALKKARRNTENAYMNLITSMEDRDIV